jgi:hypothetical protein
LSSATQAEAEDILELLLKYGVNHIDTAPAYGKAEELIGPWMDDYRDDFFLATKSRSRSFEGAWKDLQRSLSRLRVEKVMTSGGALEAFIKARDEGLVRYLGITGHGDKVPEMHKQSLERFDFDTILLPYNYLQMQKSRYASNFNELIEICQKRNIAIQTIKSVVRRPWGTRSKTHNTYFYEPLTTQEAIDKAVHWSLGLPNNFLITAGDTQILPMILDANARFEKPPSEIEMTNLVNEFDMQPIICSIRDFR